MNSASGNLQQLVARAARTGNVLPSFHPCTVQIMTPPSTPGGQDADHGSVLYVYGLWPCGTVKTSSLYTCTIRIYTSYRLIVYLLTLKLKVTELFKKDEVLELQRKSHSCISKKRITRPQSQFPHSCVCERFIYSPDRPTYFPAAD
jgi:hypothetical protein